MRRYWAIIATCLAIIAGSCITEPRGEYFVPPPVYAEWWAKTEQCSGLRGRFDQIEWYKMPGGSFFVADGTEVYGWWSESGRIFLAETLLNHEILVRHEMLHALIGRAGHPRELFVEKCAVRWVWDIE